VLIYSVSTRALLQQYFDVTAVAQKLRFNNDSLEVMSVHLLLSK
jgi:hypothetical protein